MTVLLNSMFSGFSRASRDPICHHHASHAPGTWPSFNSTNPIDLLLVVIGFTCINSDGGIPAGRSNSLHDHHVKNTKPIKTLIYICILLTPKFGKVRSLTCESNSVRNPSGGRKVSSDEFGRRVRGRQFAFVRQGNCCADFAELCGDVARAEGTNGWISDRT
jgi:hypothetical protein